MESDISLSDFVRSMVGSSLGGNGGLGLREDKKSEKDYYAMSKAIYETNHNVPCPFKVGDWVTPKDEHHIKNAGEPNLVVGSFPHTNFQCFTRGGYLEKYNMIVSCVMEGDVEQYLAFSEDYEEYKGLKYGDGGELEPVSV